jgi:hypothetical protein
MAYVHQGMTRSDLRLAVTYALSGGLNANDKALLIKLMHEKIEAVYEILFSFEKISGESKSKDTYTGDTCRTISEYLRTALEK